MKYRRNVAFIFLFNIHLFLRSSGSAKLALHGKNVRVSKSTATFLSNIEACLVCELGQVVVRDLDGESKTDYICVTDDDGIWEYSLSNLPRDFIEIYSERIHNGNNRICIANGRVNRTTRKIEMSFSDSPSTPMRRLLASSENNVEWSLENRHLAGATGSQTILVVLVTSTSGEVPGVNATQMAEQVFGIGRTAQSMNVISQFSACSNGMLQLKPATGGNVKNGILRLSYSGKIAGGNINVGGNLYNALVSQVSSAMGVSNIRRVASHVMFCMPPGAVYPGTAYWASYGTVKGTVSFYNSGNCGYLSLMMHENGHNLGFEHSGYGSFEYGDSSDYMGYGYQQAAGPRMCFNAHKNFISGWYKSRSIKVDPIRNRAWLGTLISLTDVNTENSYNFPNAMVVLNVGNYFLQLNSVKGFNLQNKGKFPNMVNIVQANNAGSTSWLQTGLGSGQNYTIENYSGGAASLTIRVCSISLGSIDTATLCIFFNDDSQGPRC